MRTTRCLFLTSFVALAACGNGGGAGKTQNTAERITAAIRVKGADVIQGSLPDASDATVTILPLEPTVLAEPGESSIMALDVSDPKQRDVDAVLLQFSDEETYQRVPQEGGGSAVQSELDLEQQICTGRCNIPYVVVVHEAVELKDGSISRSSTRQLVIDCSDSGDPDMCEGVQSDEKQLAMLLCGDATDGETVISRDPVLDAHFDAVRQLADAIDRRTQAVQMATKTIASALGLSSDSDASTVANELAMRAADQTEAGLMLRLGDRGCAIRLARVALALRTCDPFGGGELGELSCSGVCEPSDGGSCDGAEAQGCRGLSTGDKCDGACVGACEVTLESPTMCLGTCTGSCDGDCADDGNGGCNGPCSGLCQGTCRALSNDLCAGTCTGVCDAPSDGAPDCNRPLRAYCTSPSDDSVACAGDCFGDASVATGDATCQISSLAVGQIAPRCEPPLVQLAFGYAAGLDMSDQSALAQAVDLLNAPIAALVTEATRLDLLATAASDLSAAANGEVQQRLEGALADDPKSSGLACAQMRLPETTSWLEDQQATIEQLRSDVTELMSPLTPVE